MKHKQTAKEFQERMDMIHGKKPCPDCKGTGEHVINPKWPSGDQPYSEKCSTCGGTGRQLA